MTCVIDGEREPLRDEHGQPWLTCGPCAGRTRHALREIPDLVHQAAMEARVPLKAGAGGPRVGGSTEPRSPLGLDAADLAGDARAGSLAVADRTAWPEDQIGHLPVATELEFWVRDLAEVRGEGVPLPNVADLCGWLLDRLDDACRDWPPIDEMAPKIWAMHGALQGTLGLVDVPDYKRGVPCPKCGELNLYRANGTGYIQCGSCPAYISDDEYREWTMDAKEMLDAGVPDWLVQGFPTVRGWERITDDLWRGREEQLKHWRYVLREAGWVESVPVSFEYVDDRDPVGLVAELTVALMRGLYAQVAAEVRSGAA